MLLVDAATLEARRTACRGALRPLYDSLRAELDAVVRRQPEVARVKALLSRAGGRCARDGATLEFDPWSPQSHRCPRCGAEYSDETHHRAWVTSYQLWLAERCLQAALFHLLGGDARHGGFARDILRQYAERYLEFPNRDNVLGPTRLFFSTYLESIWLLQICLAASFLSRSGDAATADLVRERIVEPSAAMIAEYDEGMSNRQVWNNAALIAAAALVDDRASVDRLLAGASGLHAHVSSALLGDGTWYEGENYHQFALRGLWYGVALAESCGFPVGGDLTARFDRAFVAPFLTALPDFTLPSRKDSQYAISLRQWRIAELTELGFARSGDQRLAAALARCYETGHERRETGRSRSTADVERNMPSTLLTRADLGWRALLFATPELPELVTSAPRSALLEGQGIAVFRRADDAYVALDFGQSGGGHAHPDRLNLTMAVGSSRVLDDLGTGSYVDPSLHWYRSTLAHNAPLANGRSQLLRDGELRAYDEREAIGWVVGDFRDRDAISSRRIVVAPDYVVDELEWTSDGDTRLELPWHFDGDSELELVPATLDGGDDPEDGFAYVHDARRGPVKAGGVVALTQRAGVRAWLTSNAPFDLFSACAPGQPATATRRFYVMRSRGMRGRFRALIAWNECVQSVAFRDDHVDVMLTGGERHVHRPQATGWQVELLAGGARSSIDLGGWRERSLPAAAVPPSPPPPIVVHRESRLPLWLSDADEHLRGRALVRTLEEPHYRRSEESWHAAGRPRAEVLVTASRDTLVVFVSVRAGDLRFVSGNAENPYDNEHPDTMGAGVQFYVRTPDGSGGWMLVPEPDSDAVRARAITRWGSLASPRARWRSSGSGYEMRIELTLPSDKEYPADLDVIVNETTHARERRRGQLVFSGARGEFVYLRGDRHDAASLIPLVIAG